jgi:hypothetical protein
MLTRWTQHLKTEEEKTAFRKRIYSAKDVLDRLKAMIDADLDSLDKSEEDANSYSFPSWSHLQAHKNGNRQVYRTLKTLVDLDQQKGTISDYKPTGTN